MLHTGGIFRHILYIEDDVGLARLLQKRLARLDVTVDIAGTGEEGLERFDPAVHEAVLVDYYLPGINGMEVLNQLSPGETDPPVILLTTGGGERLAVQALGMGAADYMVKDTEQVYMDLLPAVISSACTRVRLMKETLRQQEELQRTAEMLKEEKERAEAASQAKSDFLANMSHEIRTPMNAVVGLATLLARTPLTSRQQTMVETLSTSADLLLKLINALLDLSRIEAGQLTLESVPFRLEDILRDLQAMLALQAAGKSLSFEVDCEAAAGQVFKGDRSRIQQILMNLCDNAIKFTEQGSVSVQVVCEKSAAAGIYDVRVTVSDTGIGIPQDKLASIFDKFVQTDQSITRRYGGSGLGLAISLSLARLMGGNIAVESTLGQGSTFTLYLPLTLHQRQRQPALASLPESSNDVTSQESCKILLVEDYPANVFVATLMLESLGYRCDTASNGQQALEMVQAAIPPYQVILMDVQMQGMDGYETTRRIRAWEARTGARAHIIIGVTAHALAGDREKCLAAGMDDYLAKPVNPSVLAEKLARVPVAA